MCYTGTNGEAFHFFGGSERNAGVKIQYLENKYKGQQVRPVGDKGFTVDDAFFIQEDPAVHFNAEKTPADGKHNSQHIRENKERWPGKRMYKKFPSIFEENLSKINSEIDA